MTNKLTEEQNQRFDDKFTTGIGGVLVSRTEYESDYVVLEEEVKEFLAEEIDLAKAELVEKIKWWLFDTDKLTNEGLLNYKNKFEARTKK